MKILNTEWELKNVLVVSTLVVCSLFTTAMDYLESSWQTKGFYFSESFLFSCYWWLYLPLVLIQRRVLRRWDKGWQSFLIVVGLAGLHMILYPALVMALSYLFLDHTFVYLQTWKYAMTEYPLITFLVYLAVAILGIVETYFDNNQGAGLADGSGTEMLSSILVREVDGSKTVLKVEDILYLTADSPYVAIHTGEKRYLHQVSLREMEQRLAPLGFVRIHRSTVIKKEQLQGYKSRQNGDYDLTLSNGIVLRLSRRYAAQLKTLLPAN
ncbi:MAG: LytTR family transcriptional regulator [Saprospiraceae bacterium]|nr:LytTR family transcriptional regulator [Saprospiraceae bacterium]